MDYRERWEHKDYLFGRVLERRILLFHIGLTVVLLSLHARLLESAGRPRRRVRQPRREQPAAPHPAQADAR